MPVYVVSEALAEEVTGFHVHRGALASLHREVRHTVADLLTAERLVVIEDVVDHTNVGAVLRNAAALGWDGVLLTPRAADPLYRRSVKVSMGAVFSLPWARLADWATGPELLRAAGFTTVALTLADDAVDLATVAETTAGESGEGRHPAGHRGCRPVAALDRRRRRPGRHPDAGRHRLAQRGGRFRDRLLRPRPLTRAACSGPGPTPCAATSDVQSVAGSSSSSSSSDGSFGETGQSAG